MTDFDDVRERYHRSVEAFIKGDPSNGQSGRARVDGPLVATEALPLTA